MSKNSYIIIGLIVVIVIVGFLVFGGKGTKTEVGNTTPTAEQTQPTTPTTPTIPTTPTTPAPAAQTIISVPLAAQNNSKETGTATLTANGSETEVAISLNGAPSTAQPAHIHKGTCDKLDATPAYSLTDVTNGKSDSTVSASIASLSTGGFSVNVHKSGKDIKTYVACGTIPASAPSAAAPVVPPAAPTN